MVGIEYAFTTMAVAATNSGYKFYAYNQWNWSFMIES